MSTVDVSQTKEFATLAAQAALAGYELTRITDADGRPAFKVGRWGWSRELATLGAVRVWLGLVTGKQA